MRDGVPTVCVPDPQQGNCVRPFHDTSDRNRGGPHNANSAADDIDGGRMDGFLKHGAAKAEPALRRA